MELIDQHTKKVMEGCKERARAEGLEFTDQTLEYIVTNRDLLNLGPKMMIPTLYDYWVHDVDVLKERGKYELYPHNPYETVINTRPAISFYNDNNPDWLNVMIFYHVLAHIDFFQNNLFFKNTWDFDFTGQALSDKRLIAGLRSQHGRWLDYVIEFSRSLDNLVSYHLELSDLNRREQGARLSMLDYYFDVFLQEELKVSAADYIKEIERYNQPLDNAGQDRDEQFFKELKKTHPEFEATYAKYLSEVKEPDRDLMQYLMHHSEFLAKNKNRWMKDVMQVVRKTSLFFQPQIRTKIMNEGWASYWHQYLFLKDDRIHGHEVDYSRVNAYVTSLPRVGLNPYALGMRLFEYLEEMADKGRLSLEFQRIKGIKERERYEKALNQGKRFIFQVREDYCDFTFINQFVEQDFVDRHRLFVSGKKLNRQRRTWQYYVKSRRADDYKQMLIDALYHPPVIRVDQAKGNNGNLYLNHHFEGKPLVSDFIAGTMLGIEFLWGAPVQLETSEVAPIDPDVLEKAHGAKQADDISPDKIKWQRVLYTMSNKKLTRAVLE